MEEIAYLNLELLILLPLCRQHYNIAGYLYYDLKFTKWKENIEVEILEKDDYSYELIMYAYFLMRLKQQAESAAASGPVGG